jgi:branched-chain amino acid transport system substrate-binding protein
MQKLISENKVAIIMGGAISSTAMAMAATAKRTKIPTVLNNAAAAEVTGKDCTRYSFRVPPTVEVQVRAIAPYMAEVGKKWYSITPAYAFGQDALRCARIAAKERGATIVGVDEVPGDTTDFSSYILKIRAAKPDVLFSSLVGNDLVNFLKQWNELGMRDKAVIAGMAVSDTSFWDAGAANTVGIYAKPWHYTDPKNSPAEREFAAVYRTKHGAPPSEKAWMGWFTTKSVLESIEEAKSVENAAIVTALEKWSREDNGIKVYYRSWDHQMIRPIVIVRAKKTITDSHDFFDIISRYPERQDQLENLYGTKAEIGCTIGDL